MDGDRRAPSEQENTLLANTLKDFSVLKMNDGAEKAGTTSAVEPKQTQRNLAQPQATKGTEGVLDSHSDGKPPLPRCSKHDRKVSWGMSGDSLTLSPKIDSFDEVSLLSGPPPEHSPLPSKISVKSLMNQTPFETEAEAYIQRSLDEVDPTSEGPSEAQQTILGGVPEEASSSVFATNEKTEGSSITEKKTALPLLSKGHKKTTSTAEDLFDLTISLAKLQTDRESSFLRSTEIQKQDGSHSNTDDLVKNAAQILKQRASVKAAEAPESTSRSSAADKWKILKQNIQVAAAIQAASSKKTDEQSVRDETSADVEGGESSPKEEEQDTRGRRLRKSTKAVDRAAKKVRMGYKEFEGWLSFTKMNAFTYVKYVLCLLIIPCTGVAAILFYLAGNPPCGTREECLREQIKVPVNITKDNPGTFFDGKSAASASVSWWLLFLGVRQVITFTLSRMTGAFLIDFLCLQSKVFVRLFGPFVTLFVVQSKGWPITLFFWGVYDFILLYGSNQFVKHWLFWQDKIDLFNANNPAGSVLESGQYQSLLIVVVVVPFVVACKRLWVGLFLGRQTFERFAEDLAKVMKKALLVGQVATLSKEIEEYRVRLADLGLDPEVYNVEEEGSTSDDATHRKGLLSDMDLNYSETLRINELLGEWEEPEIASEKDRRPPVSAIIQFRQSLTYLNTSFPFSAAFGPAGTRTECVESAQSVYARLLLSTPGRSCLKFDTIALAAVGRKKELDEDKVKDLIRIFRPDREGNLTMIEFVKSVDEVYKQLRLLRASVAANSRLDRAFERIFNILFYFVVILIVVAALGVDPFVLFASISGFIVGFAFAIGPACSKYFEGVLLILVRCPYGIGDRIHVSDPENETSTTGSAGWIVKDVTLFTTTVVFGTTNEVATYSNGSLAASRIINAARSPRASLNFLLKFPIDTPYKKLQVFRNAIEEFIKDRPRQWASFLAFRATMVSADLGYVEYIVVAQHRESWQQIGTLLNSKAELASFALELTKKMNIRYTSPPMPVDLTLKQGDFTAAAGITSSVPVPPDSDAQEQFMSEDASFDIGSVVDMFSSSAKQS